MWKKFQPKQAKIATKDELQLNLNGRVTTR